MKGCLAAGALALLLVFILAGLVLVFGYRHFRQAWQEGSERREVIAAWQPPETNAPLSVWFPDQISEYKLQEAVMDNRLWGLIGLHGKHPVAVYQKTGDRNILIAIIEAETENEREMVFGVLAAHHEKQEGSKSSVTFSHRARYSHGSPRKQMVAWHAQNLVIITYGRDSTQPEKFLQDWMAAVNAVQASDDT